MQIRNKTAPQLFSVPGNESSQRRGPTENLIGSGWHVYEMNNIFIHANYFLNVYIYDFVFKTFLILMFRTADMYIQTNEDIVIMCLIQRQNLHRLKTHEC